jgi:hypothetical protein
MDLSKQDMLALKPGTLLLTKKEWSDSRPGPGMAIMFMRFEHDLSHMYALSNGQILRYIIKPMFNSSFSEPVQIFNEYFEVVEK